MGHLRFYTIKRSMQLVRPHLEHANSVWCPYQKRHITELEKVQKERLNLQLTFKMCHTQKDFYA